MSRPSHPAIKRIRAADAERRKARRDQGTGAHPGEWSTQEVADLLGWSVSAIKNLINSSQLEATEVNTSGGGERKAYRLTSNGMIAFIVKNTSGPDEDANLANCEELLKAFSIPALDSLQKAITARIAKLRTRDAWVTPLEPRSLKQALDKFTPPDERQPELFAEATK